MDGQLKLEGLRDEDYDNRKAFPSSRERYAEWAERSKSFAAASGIRRDFTYGPRPRNRIDLIPGDPDKPTLFHIHGGYWQWNDKEDYACCGAAAHGAGLNVAIVEHTLAPEIPLTQIVAEVRAALDWLAANLQDQGIRNPGIIVSGHSSGGHLAAMCMDHANAIGFVLISGLFDLRPVRQIYVNDVLGMDEAEALAHSPALNPPRPNGFAILAYGEGELDAFCDQSVNYHQLLTDGGWDTALLPVPGQDHFSVLNALIEEGGLIYGALIAKLSQTIL